MVPNKSLDEYEIIASLLRDAHASHGTTFNARALRLTCNKVKHRTRMEGFGFLTKTLPRLCKALDQSLANNTALTSAKLGFAPQPNSELPRFLGEFFNKVLSKDGRPLPCPDASCVVILRRILLVYYKYELPNTADQEAKVISDFKKTEDDLRSIENQFEAIRTALDELYANQIRDRVASRPPRELFPRKPQQPVTMVDIARGARIRLNNVFSLFDPADITPSHGPGVVATRQKLWGKYFWSNVSARITSVYPFDEYFCSSAGHVCDSFRMFNTIGTRDLPARVILVPKDSRGPRLISCEPVDNQWVQQGLSRAIVRLVEDCELTKFNIFFTDQGPNQRGALLGSKTGKYATLDLKEASDRVSLSLVRLLFPEHVYTYLEACRSLATELPSKEVLTLRKYAPMGSALCFPIMALTIWALLTTVAPDTDTRESILVYGDDVIVPTAFAARAISVLESFGLRINHDKSCIQGLFKESCGVDAFKGVDVTPVRLRTVWSESPRSDVYESWIAYANSFFDKRCYETYNYIVSRLEAIYGVIPGEDIPIECPRLRVSSARQRDFPRRWNKNLQKFEFRVRVSKSRAVNKAIDGWSMLLRYFTESQKPSLPFHRGRRGFEASSYRSDPPFSVRLYTMRRTSMLVRRWR